MAGKSKKKKMVQKTVSVVNVGCGNCKFPNLSSFFNRFPKKPRLYSSNHSHYHSTTTTASSSSAVPSTTHWFSDNTSSSSATPSTAAVAVEKDSEDPYLDFRQSMLQMILENEIYSKDDLRELLNCFLSLNEPYHHGMIIRAFSEIWEGVFSAAVKRRGAVQESPLVRHHAPSRASRGYHNLYHRSM
ncbi:Ovate family protein [Raphanus sativus]|uniref:Transcription repressor n=1 Tax=Raphanus sativus TaxID=3726 RepID=A0A6J0NAE6_RAPSA|nr:transcription repressor OFP6-like [Raphanus sativus]KAJ4903708.1 Ovate family protein [Raphanus sativus]